MKKRLVIVGSGEYSTQVIDYAISTDLYYIVGFIDDFVSKDETRFGYKILGCCDDILELYANKVFDEVFIALGYNHLKKKEKLYDFFKLSNIPLAKIVSPQSIVHSSANIGAGSLIAEGVIVMKNVKIDDNVYIGTGTLIGHDSIIDKHTFIAGRVAIAGFVEIGQRNFIGVNTSVGDNIKMCNDVWISIGSIVAKNIKKPGRYFSPSLKLIKFE